MSFRMASCGFRVGTLRDAVARLSALSAMSDPGWVRLAIQSSRHPGAGQTVSRRNSSLLPHVFARHAISKSLTRYGKGSQTCDKSNGPFSTTLPCTGFPRGSRSSFPLPSVSFELARDNFEAHASLICQNNSEDRCRNCMSIIFGNSRCTRGDSILNEPSWLDSGALF